MRNISFAFTKEQFLNGTKDVTRSLGWKDLKSGQRLMAIEKGMGLAKGEKIVRLGVIEILSASRERLWMINQADVIREGFPAWTPEQFIDFFCKANECTRDDKVTRIWFKRVAE